jgi:citrate lyase beta subunit
MKGSSLLWRSMLITCGLNTRQYGRAGEVGADIGTLDWEDSVPPARKDEARRLVLAYLKAERRGGPLRCIRPNSPRSEEGLRDMLALLESGARLDALMVPKVESARELLIVENIFGDHVGRMVFLPIIETARGVANVDEIAAVPRVAGLILGAADLSTSLGSTMSWEHMYYARCRIVLAAAANDIASFDSPCFTMDVPQVLLEEIEKTAAMGFSAKVSVHPRHIEAINQGFRPRPEALLVARQVVALMEENRGQISVLNGQMIGPPAYQRARRLLARAGELALSHEEQEAWAELGQLQGI